MEREFNRNQPGDEAVRTTAYLGRRMRLRKALKHLVQHLLRLGPVTGLRILLIKQRGPGHLARITVPDLAAPLTVRTGTSDLAIFDEVVMDHGYRFPISKPPRTLIDAGANIGMATLWFKARWPHVEVIAVEPDPDNFALLQRNLQGVSGVRAVQAALTPVDGTIGFEREGLRHSSFHARPLMAGEQGIRAISMDTLLDEAGWAQCDLLKLDIEGGELELFEQQEPGWMDRVGTIAVELHDRMRPGCGHAFFRAASRTPRTYEVHEYLVVATRT
jgi:FkbM family methyltransferase